MKKFYLGKELLAQTAKGDTAAFATLFSTYYAKLFNYMFGFIKSKQVTEELVMDVFLKIWQDRDLIVEIEKFDGFLFRVAHNKSIDFLRSVARDRKFRELLLNQIQLVNHTTADSYTLVHEFEAKLREAISLLHPQQKKVYQLSRDQSLSHDQIAGHLNLSKHTINNHIVEAQRSIRIYLSKTYDLPC